MKTENQHDELSCAETATKNGGILCYWMEPYARTRAKTVEKCMIFVRAKDTDKFGGLFFDRDTIIHKRKKRQQIF